MKVGTRDNLADLFSRGIDSMHLRSSLLSYHGPQFLTNSADTWVPAFVRSSEKTPKVKKIVHGMVVGLSNQSLIRTVAYSRNCSCYGA